MAWVILIIAGILEVVWAFAMKQSDGFTKLLPTITMTVAAIGSFSLLALAMRSLPLGTAYMVWTGIGAVGAFIAGVWLLGEALTPMRVMAAAMIVSGITLMKLA